ncbi:hypothetical protein LOTGIDRAFT_119365, partial [Lottia gigantea]
GSNCQNRQNPCALPPDSGTCDELVPRYYYDKHNQHCLPFNFTGCGGNANNFRSEEECHGITMKESILSPCACQADPSSSCSCNNRETRWRYNYKQQTCEEFIYSGCQGNSNNFLSVEACQNRCVIGACCYREPMFKKKVIGYSLQGFDK